MSGHRCGALAGLALACACARPGAPTSAPEGHVADEGPSAPIAPCTAVVGLAKGGAARIELGPRPVVTPLPFAWHDDAPYAVVVVPWTISYSTRFCRQDCRCPDCRHPSDPDCFTCECDATIDPDYEENCHAKGDFPVVMAARLVGPVPEFRTLWKPELHDGDLSETEIEVEVRAIEGRRVTLWTHEVDLLRLPEDPDEVEPDQTVVVKLGPTTPAAVSDVDRCGAVDEDGTLWWREPGGTMRRVGELGEKTTSASVGPDEVALPSNDRMTRLEDLSCTLDGGRRAVHTGGPEAAIDEYACALALHGDTPGLHGELGWALLLAGRLEAAREHTERALALTEAPKARAALLYNLGRIAEASGDPTEAAARYRESLELRPHDAVQARLEALTASPGDADRDEAAPSRP